MDRGDRVKLTKKAAYLTVSKIAGNNLATVLEKDDESLIRIAFDIPRKNLEISPSEKISKPRVTWIQEGYIKLIGHIALDDKVKFVANVEGRTYQGPATIIRIDEKARKIVVKLNKSANVLMADEFYVPLGSIVPIATNNKRYLKPADIDVIGGRCKNCKLFQAMIEDLCITCVRLAVKAYQK